MKKDRVIERIGITIYNINMFESELGGIKESRRTPTQKDFESLIKEFKERPGEALEKKISGASEGSPDLTIYIQPSEKTIPYMGIIVGRGGKTFKYEMGFNTGKDAAINAVPVLTEISGGKESRPLSTVIGQSLGLNENLAGIIIQSASNAYEKPIMHTIEVGPSREDRAEELMGKGYFPRDGIGVMFDKTFKPGGAN